jgi:peptidoglycan-N-acetylglucosamine deacetylase
MTKQVFYDPRQARWKRLRRLFDVAALCLTLLLAFFIYTALRSEPLPDLLLPFRKKPYHGLKEREKEKAKERRKIAALQRRGRRKKPNSKFSPNSQEGLRAAYYVPWDAASFSSLREYARQIDLLFPEWLHVLTPDGRLQSEDQQTAKFFDVVQGGTVRAVDDRVMTFVKSEDTDMEVFPMVNNFDGTDWVDVSRFLNSPEAHRLFRQQIAATVKA